MRVYLHYVPSRHSGKLIPAPRLVGWDSGPWPPAIAKAVRKYHADVKVKTLMS